VPTGPGVRIDTGVRTGGQIPPYYDSLMGKLVVWGPDRDTALARAKQALSEFVIEGVRTVLPFHRDMVEAPEITGDSLDVYTDWVDTTTRRRRNTTVWTSSTSTTSAAT